MLVCLAAPSASAAGLRTGFTEFGAFQAGLPNERALALSRAKGAGASFIRYWVSWRAIAPVRPPTQVAARDPSWSGYHWGDLDADVRRITAAGLTPLLAVTDAPSWAEGPGRPPSSARAPAGTWRPSARVFGDFAVAIARRYDGGHFAGGAPLPRVRYWQAWNEPNLENFLTPQWQRRGSRFVAESPVLYKRLLNAFYAGVKSVSRGNFVVAAGTAPFGDFGRAPRRIPPARFTRLWLCVHGRAHPVADRRCPGGPSYFDALAHHPYPVGAPWAHAFNPDDVSPPDFSRLTRPLRAALRRGWVRPRRHKAVWATEFSWDTRPPDPTGIPLGQQASWIAAALWELWRQHVDVAIYYNLRDETDGSGWQYTLQSGAYFRGATVEQDRPKPSLHAFQLPFVTWPAGRVQAAWGIAPRSGATVVVERHVGSRWLRIGRLRSGRDRIFRGRLGVGRHVLLRARYGALVSESWRTR